MNKFIEMKKIITALSIIFISGSCFSQSIDSLFNSANTFYNEGKYSEAVNAYEDILDEGYESSALYYNLGNAYFKQNILGESILNYERAYKLNPSDEDINYNLELARATVADKFDDFPEFFLVTIFRNIQNFFSANMWRILTLFLFTIFLVLIQLFLFSRNFKLRRIFFWIACIMLVLSISCNLIESNMQKYKSAIVYIPVVNAKSSPDDAGKDVFLLHEGTKVTVRDTYNEWTKIQLPNGEQGWVASESLAVI